MRALGREQACDCSNPVLLAITQDDNGQLVDPVSLSFSIWDVSTVAKKKVPVAVVASTPVNLAACPAGSRLGKGRFVLKHTPLVTAALGTHEIRTVEKLTATSAEVERRFTFQVIASIAGPGYCTVDDLRAEDVTEDDADDLRLLEVIAQSSQFVDMACGYFFEPRFLDLSLSGRGHNRLFLNMPIVAIESVKVVSEFIPFETAPEETIVYVFNRHLRQGLFSPDDRRNPKVELGSRFNPYRSTTQRTYGAVSFPRGRQNVLVKGMFGYTDPDGSSTGGTPKAIRDVTMRLVMRGVPPVGSEDADDIAWRSRLKSESTAGQSYRLGGIGDGSYEYMTGDPEIDRTLAHYRRAINMAIT